MTNVKTSSHSSDLMAACLNDEGPCKISSQPHKYFSTKVVRTNRQREIEHIFSKIIPSQFCVANQLMDKLIKVGDYYGPHSGKFLMIFNSKDETKWK